MRTQKNGCNVFCARRSFQAPPTPYPTPRPGLAHAFRVHKTGLGETANPNFHLVKTPEKIEVFPVVVDSL